MAKRKVPKSTQNKLTKAADTLKSFSDSVVSGTDIIMNSIYLVNDSDENVSCTLLFNNIAVATSTDVILDNNVIQKKIKGSLEDFPIGSNAEVSGKFLKIFSAILATTLTPLPDDLKVEFSISGGTGTISYPFPGFKLNEAGDKVNLDISIFFLHV